VIAVNEIDQELFDTYGEAALKELGSGFNEREIEGWLKAFPIDEKTRYRVTDGLFDFYRRWASSAFAVGFRLGLALFGRDVRRVGPEEG